MIKAAKADSQFVIRQAFLPRTTALLFDRKAWFGLDRVYLAQFLYQVLGCHWAVQDACFNACLDDLVVSGALGEALRSGPRQYDELTLLLMRVLEPCMANAPFRLDEIAEIDSPLRAYIPNIALKQQVFEMEGEERGVRFRKLLAMRKAQQAEAQIEYVNHEVLALLLQLDNAEIKELLSEKEDIAYTMEILENIFNNGKLSYYEEIIENIRADSIFDSDFRPKAEMQAQQFNEQPVCQIC